MRAVSSVLAAAALLAAGSGIARAEEQQLNVYNWTDYIGTTTIADFEKATGIKVVYDTYDSDLAVEAKVMTGGANYDVVVVTGPYMTRQILAGVYLPLDKSKLPNWQNLDPKILTAVAQFDPGNTYAMPYLHGTNGFAYNIKMIKERMPDAPIDSLDMLFKPEVVSKFADCGVTLLDSPRDVLQFAFAYLHLDPNTTRKEDYDAAEQLLLKIRPYIRGFDSQEYINGLMNKEVCIAMLWSGDYAISQTRARTAHVDIDLAYTVPKEGANAWYDGMMIPKAAPHPEAALKFLNYMMDPQVIAKVSNDIHYANDNAAATPLVDPALVNNPAFYPSGEMEKRLYPMLPDPSPAVERMRTRIWTRIKTGL